VIIALAYPGSKARPNIYPTIETIDVTPHNPKSEPCHPHLGTFDRFAFVITALAIAVIAPGIEDTGIDLATKLCKLSPFFVWEYASEDLFKYTGCE